MQTCDFQEKDLIIETLGAAKITSPLKLSTVYGDNIANYVEDTESVLFSQDKNEILEAIDSKKPIFAFEKAGPRQKIFFNPSKLKAGVVTCGGLCPGINNVIRSIVMTLHYRYNVKMIFGFRYGLQGFISKYGHEPVLLTPDFVKDIHEKGGSILSSSRGHQEIGEIVDCLDRMCISILIMIGGDGTLRCAQALHEEIKKRGLKVSIIGVPKTIDNDISYVEKTFGLETAFSVASESIRSAYIEASGAPFGIGLVKVMGRLSGFIAANAALALNVVNFVLIPEVPFDLEGNKGLFKALEKRLRARGYAVIIVAEGAGRKYLREFVEAEDDSGNPKLGDIGMYLKMEIKKYFKQHTDIHVNLKYIDPSYIVRSVPANAHDAVYCMQLAQNSVHAGMAGKTGMIVGRWNSQFIHVPIRLAVSQRKYLSPEDPLWLSVLESTGQPIRMTNT